MSHATRLFIPMASCPVELRKKLKLDTSMGAFYVDDPSDTQLDWLLSKDLVTREAADLIRGFRDFTPAALAGRVRGSGSAGDQPEVHPVSGDNSGDRPETGTGGS